jgi:hypothetical protein
MKVTQWLLAVDAACVAREQDHQYCLLHMPPRHPNSAMCRTFITALLHMVVVTAVLRNKVQAQTFGRP